MRTLVYTVFPAAALIALTALLRSLLLGRLPTRLFTALWPAVRLGSLAVFLSPTEVLTESRPCCPP